jgi:hypothetical protein
LPKTIKGNLNYGKEILYMNGEFYGNCVSSRIRIQIMVFQRKWHSNRLPDIIEPNTTVGF